MENGTQHISQQVSLRIKKKTVVRKKLARDSWHGAADKVRVRFEVWHVRYLSFGMIVRFFMEFSIIFRTLFLKTVVLVYFQIIIFCDLID